MQSKLTPYLSFRDNTRDVMEYYRSIFGGKLEISTSKDYHASSDASEDNKVMHATFGMLRDRFGANWLVNISEAR